MSIFNESQGIPPNVDNDFYSTSSPLIPFFNSKPNSPASGGSPDVPFAASGLISKATLGIAFKANSVVVIFAIGLVGSVLNLLNALVFFKQGLKDPVTMTLFVLSIVDFGSVFTLWLRSVFFVLLFFPGTVPNLDPSYLSGFFTWPHAVLVRTGCLLAVFIACERWVCVTFPLQASRIITVRVAKGYNIIATGCLVGTFVSLYCYSRVELVFLPQENRTLFILTLTKDGFLYANLMSSIWTTVYLVSFGLLIIFTALIIIKLNQQTKWRQGLSSASTTSGVNENKNNKKSKMDAISSRNRKVVKMVLAMCFIFILSTLPSVTNTLVYIYLPGYVEFGRYYNLYQFNNQICFTFEVVNSTSNFFIYFNMSSNFAKTLRRLFGRDEK